MGLGLVLGLSSLGTAGYETTAGEDHPRYDLSEAVKTEYSFNIPAGTPYEVSIDHATGEVTISPADPQPFVLPGIAAGCVSQQGAPGINWARDPPTLRPVMGCPHQTLTKPIARTVITCFGTGNCFTDGAGVGEQGFGNFVIGCSRPGVHTVSWSASPLPPTGTCRMIENGSNPNTWLAWDSICDGGGAGVIVCLHLYR